jgi:uncharacterized protein (DUF924 family)
MPDQRHDDEFDAETLLEEWFGATREQPELIPERMGWWFGADQDRDRRLFDRYGLACRAARTGALDDLADTPHGRLALILLLDQLPRNLHRGTGEAFATDDQALDWCLDGHHIGLDQPLTLIERVFFWMPLQHAEDLERQELGVQLFTSLAAEDPARDALWSGFANYAERHHDVIQRFGRFPHRNTAMGRTTTDREQAWLDSGGDTFGG